MRAIIFANGVLTNPITIHPDFAPDDLIIAADGGLLHCTSLGITPTALIGDFDSLLPEDIVEMEKRGVTILRHPREKDETDLELALRYAAQQHPERILIFGALGARWDQTMANLLLPALDEFHEQEIRLLDGSQELTILNAPARTHLLLAGIAGDTVSLIPVSGDVQGVRTQGLEYPLKDETLVFGATRGVSNTLITDKAEVEIRRGSLMVIVIHHQKPATE